MRTKHKIYVCEDCFAVFSSLEDHANHKDHGHDPCCKSCREQKCRRRKKLSAPLPQPCAHLETSQDQWHAAYDVVHVLLLDRLSLDTSNFPHEVRSESGVQDLSAPDVEIIDGTPDLNFSTVLDSSSAVLTIEESYTSEQLVPDAAYLEIESILAVHDLLPRVTELEGHLSHARSDQARLQAELSEARNLLATQNTTRNTLAMACSELAATASLSPMMRQLLAQDAPDVLYNIDRLLPSQTQRDYGMSAAVPDIVVGLTTSAALELQPLPTTQGNLAEHPRHHVVSTRSSDSGYVSQSSCS